MPEPVVRRHPFPAAEAPAEESAVFSPAQEARIRAIVDDQLVRLAVPEAGLAERVLELFRKDPR